MAQRFFFRAWNQRHVSRALNCFRQDSCISVTRQLAGLPVNLQNNGRFAEIEVNVVKDDAFASTKTQTANFDQLFGHLRQASDCFLWLNARNMASLHGAKYTTPSQFR